MSVSALTTPSFAKAKDLSIRQRVMYWVKRSIPVITLVIDLAERVKMLIQQLPQVGCVRIAWLVEW